MPARNMKYVSDKPEGGAVEEVYIDDLPSGGDSYVLPAASTDALGGVKQAAAISDISAAPTQQDFNGLLAALRTTGILASA